MTAFIRLTTPYRLLVGLLAFLPVAVVCLCCFTAPTVAYPASTRKVVAAIPADFPPTYFKDKNGKPAGFAVDVMNELAQRSGLTVEYVFGEAWDDVIQKVLNGEADLIPNLTIDEKRKKLLAFSTPIEFAAINLIVVQENHSVKQIAPGLTIGVMKDSAAQNLLKNNESIKLVPYNNLPKMLFELLAGTIDGSVTLTQNMMKLAIDVGVEDKIKVVGKPAIESKRAIAVRPDDKELLAQLNKGIAEFTGTKTYQDIYTKWYGKPKSSWSGSRIIAAMAILFGILLGILAIVRYRAITAMNRKQATIIGNLEKTEAALRESREQLSLLLASTAEGIYGVDLSGVCTFANPSCSRLLGYSSDDLLGKNMHELIHHTREDGTPYPAENCCLLWVIRKGEGFHADNELFWRADGTSFPAEYWSYPMMHEGMLVGAVITFQDVTDRKQAEDSIRLLNAELEDRVIQRTAQLTEANEALANEIAQRKQAQEEVEWLNTDLQRRTEALESANRELESFSYSVSHDLRAPLRHMSGYSRMLLEDYRETLPAEGVEYLERIEQAGDKMGHLIDALLQLSRFSRAELNLQHVNLSRLAREIIAEFQEATPERHVQVECAEGLTAEADPVLIRVVMENLLGNAWKYTRNISPAIIGFSAEEKDGMHYFCIRDNGTGFDMTYADKLFGAFQRLHGTEYEGTGIGLATVQRIIRRHGGTIRAEAEPGKGATFCFRLG